MPYQPIAVSLLAILGSQSIAVPLSHGFPPSELRYILNNSEATLLMSSQKFKPKAQEVLSDGLDAPTVLNVLHKRLGDASSESKVVLEDVNDPRGGMMLYTSGTTNRPASQLPAVD